MFNRHGRSGMLLRQADNGAGASGMQGAGSAEGAGTGAAGRGEGENADTPTFETWYAGLDTTQRGLVDNHVTGLKTALASERVERANLSKQIGALQKDAGKDSDLAKQLTDLQNTLAITERRAAFVEDAIRPEVNCVNVKAAWALAQAEEMFDRQGRPDWNALKAAAPELFRRLGAGNADGGAGQQQQRTVGMNELIRRAAGRG